MNLVNQRELTVANVISINSRNLKKSSKNNVSVGLVFTDHWLENYGFAKNALTFYLCWKHKNQHIAISKTQVKYLVL